MHKIIKKKWSFGNILVIRGQGYFLTEDSLILLVMYQGWFRK